RLAHVQNRPAPGPEDAADLLDEACLVPDKPDRNGRPDEVHALVVEMEVGGVVEEDVRQLEPVDRLRRHDVERAGDAAQVLSAFDGQLLEEVDAVEAHRLVPEGPRELEEGPSLAEADLERVERLPRGDHAADRLFQEPGLRQHLVDLLEATGPVALRHAQRLSGRTPARLPRSEAPPLTPTRQGKARGP